LLPSPMHCDSFDRPPCCILPSRSAVSGAMKAAYCPGFIEPKALIGVNKTLVVISNIGVLRPSIHCGRNIFGPYPLAAQTVTVKIH
jgi:hypothetical protein